MVHSQHGKPNAHTCGVFLFRIQTVYAMSRSQKHNSATTTSPAINRRPDYGLYPIGVEEVAIPTPATSSGETPSQCNYNCTGSTWSKTFFPPEPPANLFTTSLTISVASSSLSFPSILTISCLGSLSCSIFSASNQGHGNGAQDAPCPQPYA